jgi:hypothetical protein
LPNTCRNQRGGLSAFSVFSAQQPIGCGQPGCLQNGRSPDGARVGTAAGSSVRGGGASVGSPRRIIVPYLTRCGFRAGACRNSAPYGPCGTHIAERLPERPAGGSGVRPDVRETCSRSKVAERWHIWHSVRLPRRCRRGSAVTGAGEGRILRPHVELPTGSSLRERSLPPRSGPTGQGQSTPAPSRRS